MTMTFSTQTIGSAEPIISGDEMYQLGLAASTGAETGIFDLVTAHKWFNLAALKGSNAAKRHRAELAEDMNANEISEALNAARNWLSSRC